jgi:hypothetical protein
MGENELIRAARRYFGGDVRLVADEDTRVVRPASFIDPHGCTAVRITDRGGWEEGWWSPDGDFRPFD